MNTGVRHLFIAAPIELVRSAWEDFVAQRSADCERHGGHEADDLQTVHLIPAEGGCFLAIAKLARRQHWARTCRALGLRRAAPLDELELFAREFEEGRHAPGVRESAFQTPRFIESETLRPQLPAIGRISHPACRGLVCR